MDRYVKVAKIKEIPPGSVITVPDVDRVDICLVNLDGRFHAVSNVCTHKGARLNEGHLGKGFLVCPWHKASFKLDNGMNSWPAPKPIRSFEVKIEENDVYIRLPAKNEDLTYPRRKS